MNEEQEMLLQLYKKAETGRENMRYHALLLVKTGTTITYVSRIFYVDEETVRVWMKKWDEDKNIQDKQRSGKKPKLTKGQEELCELVDENNPQKHGYNIVTWDCVELKKFVFDKFILTHKSFSPKNFCGFVYLRVYEEMPEFSVHIQPQLATSTEG